MAEQSTTLVVWKYTMPGPRSVFDVPRGARFISVGLQNETEIVLWAEVNPARGLEQRVFNAVRTGEQLPPDRVVFIGTVQVGWVVWHIYEVAA